MISRILVLLFLFLLIPTPGNSQASASEVEIVRLNYFVDDSKSLTVDDAVKRFAAEERIEPIRGVPRLGITAATVWVEAELNNQTDLNFFIFQFKDPSLFEVVQFLPDSIGYVETRNGVSVPLEDRYVPGLGNEFYLPIPSGERRTVYYRIQSKNYISLPVKVEGLAEYYVKTSFKRILLGSYYGILAILFFITAVFFFITRVRIFILYAIYILTFGAITGTYDGFTPTFLPWIVSVFDGYHDVVMVVLSNLFSLLFMRDFLQTKLNAPRFDKVVKISLWISVVLIPLNFFIPVILLQVIPLVSLAMLAIVLMGGVIGVRSKVPQSQYFLAAYGSFAVFVSITIFSLLTILPVDDFTLHSLHIGYLLSLIFLAIALGYRFNYYKNKLVTQEAEKHKLKLQGAERRNLELETSLKQSLGLMSQKEENLRAILDNNNDDAIWLVDDNLQLIDFNKFFEDAFLVTYGAQLKRGSRITDYLKDPDLFDRWTDRYTSALQGEKGLYIDEYMINEQRRVYEISTYPIHAEDRIRGVSVYSKDITEKFIVEEKLKNRNEELLKLNKELDRFVYSASHDLKAPLASVLGLISISRMEDNPPKREEYFSLMEQSINKLNTFIQEIIDYSKSSRLEIERSKIDLKAIIGSVIDGLRYINGFEGVDLEVTIENDIDFYSDPKRLQIVISNLVNNAYLYSIKYNGAKGERSQIEVSALIREDSVKLKVKDNGPGVESEIREKIFEMFYRGQSDIKGSGLGLFIVKETLAKIGGTVSVESEKGKGSVFTVEVPNLIEAVAEVD